MGLADERYTIQPGDTLWDLADRIYGIPLLWPQLWQRNPHITDPNQIRAGDEMGVTRVPRLSPAREQQAHAEAEADADAAAVGVAGPEDRAPEPEPAPEPDPEPEIPQLVLDIRQALAENRVDDARQLAEDGFNDYVGIPEYDFEAGRAHFHSGNFDHAMGHFDRAVMVEPRNMRYRLELARARFAARDFEGARGQFIRVLDADPPDTVADNIQRFLDIIDRRLAGRRPSTEFWAEGGLGYDDNPLGAADDSFDLLFFGIVLEDQVSLEAESDWFHFQEVGVSRRQPRTRTSAWEAEASFRNRGYFDVDDADQQQAQAQFGPQWEPAEGHSRSVPVQLSHIRLGGETFRTALTVLPEARIPLDGRTLLRFQGQVGYADYEDSDRDGPIAGAGVTAIRVLSEDADWIGVTGLTYGRDQADARAFRRDRLGGVVGLQHLRTPETRLGANLSLTYERAGEARDIQGLLPDVSDSAERSTTARLALSGQHDFNDSGWTALAETSYTEKFSNVDLFEYDRFEIFAGVRYEH